MAEDKSFGVAAGQKWVRGVPGVDREVRVMAVADGWAMVRRPGCAPFAVFCKDMAVGAHWHLRPSQCSAKGKEVGRG